MKRSFEERLGVVQEAEGGKPIRQLSREHGLHGSKIIEWVRKYRKYGEEGLRKQPHFKATGEIREALARQVLEKGVTLSRIVVDYQVSCRELGPGSPPQRIRGAPRVGAPRVGAPRQTN